MEVLSVSAIEQYIIPSLRVGLRGKAKTIPIVAVVQAILYRLKTGCQWRALPLKEFFDDRPYTWKGVYHHFNRWVRNGSWSAAFVALLKEHRRVLDMSSVQLDGSHTPAKRGGQAVGYQGRKRCKTTNILVISDSNGTPVSFATPQSGEHHDTFEIQQVLREMMALLEQAGIAIEGLFLNADAGFDTNKVRSFCQEVGIEANIPVNARNTASEERQEYFDEELYKQRTVIERTFAWLDSFKAVLVRYETKLQNWTALHTIAFVVLFIRRILKQRKC